MKNKKDYSWHFMPSEATEWRNKMENTKIDLSWFNDENFDLVENQIETNMSNLLDIDEYLKLICDIHKLTLELTSKLSSEQYKIFRKYENLNLQVSSYHNNLAYYLGLKEKNDLKTK